MARPNDIKKEKEALADARKQRIASIHNPRLRPHPTPPAPPAGPGQIGPGIGAPGLEPPIYNPYSGNTQAADTGTPAPAPSSGFSISTMLILIVLGIVAFIIYDKVIK